MSKNRVVMVDVTTGQVAEFYAGELGNDPIFLTVDEPEIGKRQVKKTLILDAGELFIGGCSI